MSLAMWIDQQIMRACHESFLVRVWVPQTSMVVLGSSNDPAIECCESRCEGDRIPILKRTGGGGAVVLHPGCVVVSLGAWVKDYYRNKFYFSVINQALIGCLSSWRPELQLEENGLSDIATATGRKVAGTSLFRSRNYLLYQGSILVDARAELFAKYLKFPSRVPEYRAGRSHESFVTGLAELVPSATPAAVANHLQESLMVHLSELRAQLIDAPADQIPFILERSR